MTDIHNRAVAVMRGSLTMRRGDFFPDYLEMLTSVDPEYICAAGKIRMGLQVWEPQPPGRRVQTEYFLERERVVSGDLGNATTILLRKLEREWYADKETPDA